MSDQYITNEGFKPLLLPAKGEELLEGRQYVLTPLARLVLQDEFGLGGVPTIVECIRRKVAETRIETITTNMETGQISSSKMMLDAQAATFRYLSNGGKKVAFTLSIEELEARAPMYMDSHKLPYMEREWFANSHLPPSNLKFRGCSLRWWIKSREEGVKVGKARSERTARSINLSDLD